MILDLLNPRYVKAEEEDKIEAIVKGIIRIGTDLMKGQIAGIEDSLDKIGVYPDVSQEGTIFEIVLEDTVDEIAEGSIEMIIIGIMVTIEAGIGPEKERSFLGNNIAVIKIEVQAIVDHGQDPEPVLIRIG